MSNEEVEQAIEEMESVFTEAHEDDIYTAYAVRALVYQAQALVEILAHIHDRLEEAGRIT